MMSLAFSIMSFEFSMLIFEFLLNFRKFSWRQKKFILWKFSSLCPVNRCINWPNYTTSRFRVFEKLFLKHGDFHQKIDLFCSKFGSFLKFSRRQKKIILWKFSTLCPINRCINWPNYTTSGFRVFEKLFLKHADFHQKIDLFCSKFRSFLKFWFFDFV